MRRLKRPWLLLFPLVGAVGGVAWLSIADRGTVPSRGGVPAVAPEASYAIASSDIGFRLDLKARRISVYEPRYEAGGEEKLRPPRTFPLDLGAGVQSVGRTPHEILLGHKDGAKTTYRLASDGRSVVADFTGVGPNVGRADANRTYRTYRTELPEAGKAIARPEVSIRIESDDPRDGWVASALLDSLVTALHPRLRRSIAPMGLTNEIYFGHVFWDADVWVFPALALLTPEAAAEIPKYRLRTLPEARRNFDGWLQAGRLTARGVPSPPEGVVHPEIGGPFGTGAKFAWESSESGKETVPGPSRFEDHISGSVAWSVGMADDLGLVPSTDARRLRKEVGAFYRERSTGGSKGLQILATVSPDEHHTGDNDLYTNALAQELTGERYHLPSDRRGLLNYDGDRGKGYKQAAGLLAVFPLQFPPAEAQAGKMLDRFAPGVIPNGPAMTDAIHAIVAARIGRADEGLRYWRRSWEGFYDSQRGMFSERRRGTRREYFYTGAAGTLQAVLYGFVGLRVDRAGGAGTLIARLKNGKELRCSPHLPKGWRSVAISGLSVMGRRYDLTVFAGGRVQVRPAASK